MSYASSQSSIAGTSGALGAHSRRLIALTIAGFDPSSGAGITADLKVFAAHRVYGMAAITGLTVQSTQGVRRNQPVDPQLFQETLDCLAEDANFDGIKIGMLSSSQNAKIIRFYLEKRVSRHIVLDPILRSTSGELLSGRDDLRVLQEVLLDQVTWITPNLMELSALVGREVKAREEMPDAAARLQQQVSGRGLNVFVTGGHLPIPEDYVLTSEGEAFWLPGQRVDTTSTHGTGCTLSSALLCLLMKGLSPRESAEAAKGYVTAALRTAYPIGKGHGPLNHFFTLEGESH